MSASLATPFPSRTGLTEETLVPTVQVPQGRRPVQRVDDLCLRRALRCVAPLPSLSSQAPENLTAVFLACNLAVKFILLHEGRNDDGIRNFFLDVFEAWTKVRPRPRPVIVDCAC